MNPQIKYDRTGGRRFYLDGREVTEAEFDDRLPPADLGAPMLAQQTEGWPVVSDALAVHPRQVAEATEDARRKGVPVEFQKDGRPKFETSRQFREYARAYGFEHRGYA